MSGLSRYRNRGLPNKQLPGLSALPFAISLFLEEPLFGKRPFYHGEISPLSVLLDSRLWYDRRLWIT
ncbi:hypothetical protein RRG08_005338 [Elysia crispata]|uniref:Uncharacterized protein n=1 Tax=Elysia crispata TaxID=231223 RepID=A0AAE1CTK5_9GAST|nr:hypothetical protein RRG08_005338 [Elysia crispata]